MHQYTICMNPETKLGAFNPNRRLTRRTLLREVGNASLLTIGGIKGTHLGYQSHTEGIRVIPPWLVSGPDFINTAPSQDATPLFSIQNESTEHQTGKIITRAQYIPYEAGALGVEFQSKAIEVIVGHRAGNDLATIERAAQVGCTDVDIDATEYKGEMYANHDALFKGWGPFWFTADTRTGRVKLFKKPLKLEDSFKKAGEFDLGVSLELKHGKFTRDRIKEIIALQQRHSTRLMVHSQNSDLITLGKESSKGTGIRWLNVPMNDEEWEKCLTSIDDLDNSGFLTDEYSAEKREKQLTNVFVLIGNVKSREVAEKVTKIKIANGVMVDF